MKPKEEEEESEGHGTKTEEAIRFSSPSVDSRVDKTEVWSARWRCCAGQPKSESVNNVLKAWIFDDDGGQPRWCALARGNAIVSGARAVSAGASSYERPCARWPRTRGANVIFAVCARP